MTLSNGKLRVPQDGRYYLYSQVIATPCIFGVHSPHQLKICYHATPKSREMKLVTKPYMIQICTKSRANPV